jgi:hypothetical protein
MAVSNQAKSLSARAATIVLTLITSILPWYPVERLALAYKNWRLRVGHDRSIEAAWAAYFHLRTAATPADERDIDCCPKT